MPIYLNTSEVNVRFVYNNMSYNIGSLISLVSCTAYCAGQSDEVLFITPIVLELIVLTKKFVIISYYISAIFICGVKTKRLKSVFFYPISLLRWFDNKTGCNMGIVHKQYF